MSELNALPWVEVSSRNIARLAWVKTTAQQARVGRHAGNKPPDLGDLFVHFYSDGSETVYRYFDVPESVYESVRNAGSVGGMHHKIVKDRYRYERIEPEPDELPEDEDPLVIALNRLADVAGSMDGRLTVVEATLTNVERYLEGIFKRRISPDRRETNEQHSNSDPPGAPRPVERRRSGSRRTADPAA